MPDFTVQISTGARVVWLDPVVPEGPTTGSGGRPTRLNPNPTYPHTYRRVHVGSAAVVQAIVGGVVSPPDSALGGRLFTAAFAAWPGIMPWVVQGAGYSSTITFAPPDPGYYLLMVRRPDGGAIGVPIIAEFA